MAIPTIVIGLLLIIVGLIGYFLGTPPEGADAVSVTALIPAFFGAVLFVLGLVAAQIKGKAVMHVMHVAVLIGLLGLVGSAMRIPKSIAAVQEGGEALALYAQSAMAVLCFIYVALCIRSFVNARIKKQAE
ncbi:hypothetical protein [Rubellicoccus peritrichatus]|uniref:Uncharacterized protein n=1 Tax=Rubellicoccus peritrichatus TaxID=3080537 RepID=A0AAQ3L8G3_9BACT|nr:hypothetical protein [Puniceicoccus sp. CR14]WOO39849.1 hypothetical protein RZN69_14585 [Puniceicoccus sp. CR14]